MISCINMKERLRGLSNKAKHVVAATSLATAGFLGGTILKRDRDIEQVRQMMVMDKAMEEKVKIIEEKIRKTIEEIAQATEDAKKRGAESSKDFLKFIEIKRKIIEEYEKLKDIAEKSRIPPKFKKIMDSQL